MGTWSGHESPAPPPELPITQPWFVRGKDGGARLIRHLDPARASDVEDDERPAPRWPARLRTWWAARGAHRP